MATPSSSITNAELRPQPAPDLFTVVDSYPWSSDPDFQIGVSAILDPATHASSSCEQLDDLVLRARAFYYERKYDTPVDFMAYKVWRAEQPESALSSLSIAAEKHLGGGPSQNGVMPNTNSDFPTVPELAAASGQASSSDVIPLDPPQYPHSFQDIIQMITTGQTVPGIREIPNTVLVGHGSEPRKGARRKPWEGQTDLQTSIDSLDGTHA